MKHFLLSLTMAVMPMGAFAQFGVVAPLHVSGKQLVDQGGHTVVLHGVMDTPNPYFNRYRWGSACNDGTVASCINYFDKVFGALQNPAKGTYCNIFRLHLDPCWTNNGHASGEADISKFSADRQVSADALLAYCSEGFEPWALCGRASAGGMPEGSESGRRLSAIPQDGMEYRVKQCQLQKQFGNGVAGTGQRACACL